MPSTFKPDYRNIELSARNIEVARLPLYEHVISVKMMETLLNKPFADLANGDYADKKEYVRHYCQFYEKMGYDAVSFEMCIGAIMPESGSLGGHKDGAIKTMADFERYPWDSVLPRFFDRYGDYFRALSEVMPEGMKAVGGPGNGIFECVQDIVGFQDLCYIKSDDEELYRMLFRKVGQVNLEIWQRFMREYSDAYCVLRFGDDLGYKSNTLLAAEDVKQYIIPEYARIIEVVHQSGKPFLLHSCGCIFSVMEELIEIARIDAKHSNEDQIAPFPYWVDTYGDRIGNFGGIDTDAVCRLNRQEMKEYIVHVVQACKGKGGFAFSTGNSIPDYVPVEGYTNMIEIVRELRGDYRA
jgi:uroporphyrinogen decarboxylase